MAARNAAVPSWCQRMASGALDTSIRSVTARAQITLSPSKLGPKFGIANFKFTRSLTNQLKNLKLKFLLRDRSKMKLLDDDLAVEAEEMDVS